MKITPAMIEAHAILVKFARQVPRLVYPSPSELVVAKAIDVLDNADFFVAIDEAANEAETAAQFAAMDPEEWGDTTRADMARHREG